ncbi:MAG: response regulator [Pseudomonadota bacterium]
MSAFKIFLVEDNADHARLIADTLKENAFATDLVHCGCGREALDRLQVAAAKGSLPDLILLDLNMPGLSGIDVLRRIKTDGVLRVIPTVMLSTSPAPSDIQACLSAHANSYICKSADIDELERKVTGVCTYWHEINVSAGAPNWEETLCGRR